MRLTRLTPGCATPAPALLPDPGQSRDPKRGTPPLLPLKRGVRPLRAEHSRIWEARPVPHRLRGKNGEKEVSGSDGVGAQPAWPPPPSTETSSPCLGQKPLESLRGSLRRGLRKAPGHAVPLAGLGGLGGPGAGCLRHSGTQMSLWELKRRWPSGQKQPSASPVLSGLWLLQGDKGRLRVRAVGTAQAWGQPRVWGRRSGGGRAPPRSGAGVLEPRGSPPGSP